MVCYVLLVRYLLRYPVATVTVLLGCLAMYRFMVPAYWITDRLARGKLGGADENIRSYYCVHELNIFCVYFLFVPLSKVRQLLVRGKARRTLS